MSQFDLSYKTSAYHILRHPEGDRKDVLRWTDLDGNPIAELEIYRPGGELGEAAAVIAEIVGRMDPTSVREFEGPAPWRVLMANIRPSRWFSCNFQGLAGIICAGVAQLT